MNKPRKLKDIPLDEILPFGQAKHWGDRMSNEKELTCWDCGQRISEECGIDGHEVYIDSKRCSSFEILETVRKVPGGLKYLHELLEKNDLT